jgi:hypothetical protein
MTMAQFNLAGGESKVFGVGAKGVTREEALVVKENKPVVKIVAIKPVGRKPGTGKGIWMSPDFDKP